MRIGQRLYLAVLPAVLGLLLVAALAYWGQYAYQVPLLVVVVAAVASVGSVFMAWRNTRYVASRIERLATQPRVPRGSGDEIESIERTVGALSAEVERERGARARSESKAQADRVEVSRMLAGAAESATRAIDEVRLPLHILLANRFGELNENQEEMLGAAQAAVENAATVLERARLLAQLDGGTLEPRRDPVHLADVVAAALPALQMEAARSHVEMTVDLAPALPRVVVDQSYFQDAFATLIRAALVRAGERGRVQITTQQDDTVVRLTIVPGTNRAEGLDHAIAIRLLAALNARVNEREDGTDIRLPAVTHVRARGMRSGERGVGSSME